MSFKIMKTRGLVLNTLPVAPVL